MFLLFVMLGVPFLLILWIVKSLLPPVKPLYQPKSSNAVPIRMVDTYALQEEIKDLYAKAGLDQDGNPAKPPTKRSPKPAHLTPHGALQERHTKPLVPVEHDPPRKGAASSCGSVPSSATGTATLRGEVANYRNLMARAEREHDRRAAAALETLRSNWVRSHMCDRIPAEGVVGLTPALRGRLHQAGILAIEDLFSAALTSVYGIGPKTAAALDTWARTMEDTFRRTAPTVLPDYAAVPLAQERDKALEEYSARLKALQSQKDQLLDS